MKLLLQCELFCLKFKSKAEKAQMGEEAMKGMEKPLSSNTEELKGMSKGECVPRSAIWGPV